MSEPPSINLTHHFLIAMPGMADDVFAGSVVYVCEHSARGALGLMINKPADIQLSDLFAKVDLPQPHNALAESWVVQGGPVHTERGFVLHEAMTPADDAPHPKDTQRHAYASSLKIEGSGLEMTTSRDVLEALSHGNGPRQVLISLGYSAWEKGQLESELAANAWLTVAADPHIVFDTPHAQRYDRALALLGLQAWQISPHAGRA